MSTGNYVIQDPEGVRRIEEFVRKLHEEGEAKGRAEGKADALLRVLAQRGVELSKEQRDRVRSCSDNETLDGWIDRALRAGSADELFE